MKLEINIDKMALSKIQRKIQKDAFLYQKIPKIKNFCLVKILNYGPDSAFYLLPPKKLFYERNKQKTKDGYRTICSVT